MNASLLPVARPLLALRRSRHAATACGADTDGPRQGPRRRRGLAVSRRGSILIFVVALLVLLAVIGTAYLSTTRTDRYATQQNGYNTEVDLLVDGVLNAAQATVVGDLFGGGQFRPVDNAGGYDDWDGPFGASLGDGFLAARVPTLRDPNTAFGANGANSGVWYATSAPVIGENYSVPGIETGYTGSLDYYNNRNLVPGRVTVNGVDYPAFYNTNVSPPGVAASFDTNNMKLAADTDGDGIADAGLVRLPVGRIAGVTYYYAVRIVDHGSAVNVNTAGTMSADYGGTGNKLGYLTGFFPSNIGLAEMMLTLNPSATTYGGGTGLSATEFDRLNFYRTNTNDGLAYGVVGDTANPNPIHADATGKAVADMTFQYLSQADALEMQLGRRPGNPGFSTLTANFQTYDLSVEAALAYPFGLLADPSTTTATFSNQLQKDLPTTVVFSSPNSGTNVIGGDQKFKPEKTDDWFQASFNYAAEMRGNTAATVQPTTFLPPRTLLTTSSPVSNLMRPKRGQVGNTLLPPAEMVATAARTVLNVEQDDYTDTMGRRRIGYYPADGVVPRVSPNTGSLMDLWVGFWNVMAEGDWTATANVTGTAFEQDRADYLAASGNADFYDPYQGMKFTTAAPGALGAASSPAAPGLNLPIKPIAPQTAEFHPLRMFRNVIRIHENASTDFTAATNPLRLHARQMVLLRSAIAAANAADLRDVDDAITRLPVQLPSFGKGQSGNNPSLEVAVYGHEAQPYLTEFFAQTDTVATPAYDLAGTPNIKGYVAIEFYNPHPFPIDLSECKFARIARPSDGAAGRNLEDMEKLAATPIILANAKSNLMMGAAYTLPTIVPAGGYLVMENYDATTGAASPTRAAYRPRSANLPVTWADPNGQGPIKESVTGPKVNFAFVENLDELLNHEFVLVRPLAATRLLPRTVAGVTTTPTLYYRDAATPANQADAPTVDPGVNYSDGANTPITTIPPTRDAAVDMAPLDSLDVTGLQVPGLAAEGWHYARDTGVDGWRFVYPGRYDGGKPMTVGAEEPRQQGILRAVTYTPGMLNLNPWEPGSDVYIAPDPQISLGAASTTATYPQTFPIQLTTLTDEGMGVPAGTPATSLSQTLNSGPLPHYPFGGFARNGDLLKVPFIGSYRIRERNAISLPNANPQIVVEMNAITTDSAFAEDTDTNDDPQPTDLTPCGSVAREQVGRFAPLRKEWVNAPNAVEPLDGNTNVLYDDLYDPRPAPTDYPTPAGELRSRFRYRWARDLFDYFSVQDPQADYLPENYSSPFPGSAVSNQGGTANGPNEKTTPIEGLINLNSAPTKVLEMIAWVPAGRDNLLIDRTTDPAKPRLAPGTDQVDDNVDIANVIALYRDGNLNLNIAPQGPFTSLYDLYQIPGMAFAQQQLLAADPGPTLGDFSPLNGGTDNVRNDFEEQYLILDRVSNFLTLRSDSFTVYVDVQGWRNAGTPQAEMVVERRAVRIVDRSRVAKSGDRPIVYPIPAR